MANTKNALLRTMVIDRCLRDKRRRYSTEDIMRECNKALEAQGMAEVMSLNTIRDDINAIQDRWKVEVETISEGRNRYYAYKDRNFSIYKTVVTDNQREKFVKALGILEELRSELFL